MSKFYLEYYHIPMAMGIIATVVYVIRYKKLVGSEKWICWILLANSAADATSEILAARQLESHVVYNLLIPVERAITLLVYALHAETSRAKRMYRYGIGLVAIITLLSLAYYRGVAELHYHGNVASGFVVAIFSYTHLRALVIGSTKYAKVLFFFGLANLIYYTLLISAMTALPLAMRISMEFASDVYYVQLVGYALWSITLTIGISWKKQRT